MPRSRRVSPDLLRSMVSLIGRVTLLSLAAGWAASCVNTPSPAPAIAEEETVRDTERLRLRLLVAGDVAAARNLHADDFQLINPAGKTFSREEYLGSLSSGYLDYLQWEPGPIDVRLVGDLAVIRYRSQLQVSLDKKPRELLPHWHTDLYQKRGGRWQVVWSQATEVR